MLSRWAVGSQLYCHVSDATAGRQRPSAAVRAGGGSVILSTVFVQRRRRHGLDDLLRLMTFGWRHWRRRRWWWRVAELRRQVWALGVCVAITIIIISSSSTSSRPNVCVANSGDVDVVVVCCFPMLVVAVMISVVLFLLSMLLLLLVVLTQWLLHGSRPRHRRASAATQSQLVTTSLQTKKDKFVTVLWQFWDGSGTVLQRAGIAMSSTT